MREHKFKGYKFYSHTTETGVFTLNQHRDYEEDYWDEIVQFTGLLDREGVEIYEGDIVHEKSWWWGPGEVKPFYTHGGQDRSYISGSSHNYWNLDEIEVIGNIYQNPELLEK